MARSLPTHLSKILGKTSRSHHVRVQVKHDGVWKNLSALNGTNWVESWSSSEDVDTPVQEAKIRLFRNHYWLSLATLNEDSRLNKSSAGAYMPLLDLGTEITVETAVTPYGTKATSGDWMLVFRGEIDVIDNDNSDSPFVDLTVRDKGCRVVDAWVENEKVYGSTASLTPVETVMQSLLNDWVAAPVPTLKVEGTPNWSITAFRQEPASVMEALNSLAQQFGWMVRYKWSEADSDFVLTLFQPDRTGSTVAAEIPPYLIFNSQKVTLSRQALRNVVQVTYGPKENRRTVERSDLGSINKYGRRWMRIEEDPEKSAIDTETEAIKMADSAVADLKDPKVEIVMETGYRPDLQIGDMITVKADGRAFTTDQTLAIISIDHKIDAKSAVTGLGLRGLPSGGFLRWLRRGKGIPLSPKAVAALTPQSKFKLASRTTTAETWTIDATVGLGGTGPVQAQIEKTGADGVVTVVKAWTAVPFDQAFNITSGADLRFTVRLKDADGRESDPQIITIPGNNQALPPKHAHALKSRAATTETWTINGTLGENGSGSVQAKIEQYNASGVATLVKDWTLVPFDQAFTIADGAESRFKVTLRDGNLLQGDGQFITVTPNQKAQPPICTPVMTASSEASETWRFDGTLGTNGTGPVQVQVEKEDTAGTTTIVQAWATAGFSLILNRQLVWAQTYRIRVRDGNALEGAPQVLTIGPKFDGIDWVDGRIKPNVYISGTTKTIADIDTTAGSAKSRVDTLADDDGVLKPLIKLGATGPTLDTVRGNAETGVAAKNRVDTLADADGVLKPLITLGATGPTLDTVRGNAETGVAAKSRVDTLADGDGILKPLIKVGGTGPTLDTVRGNAETGVAAKTRVDSISEADGKLKPLVEIGASGKNLDNVRVEAGNGNEGKRRVDTIYQADGALKKVVKVGGWEFTHLVRAQHGLFLECFEDSAARDDYHLWWPAEVGNTSIVSGGLVGGKMLRATARYGSHFKQWLPYAKDKLHRVRARFRVTQAPTVGNNELRFGVVAVNASKSDLGTVYAYAKIVNSVSDWTEVTGYFRGTSADAAKRYNNAINPFRPSALHDGTAYVRPFIGANIGDGNAIVEIDYMTVEIMDENTQERTGIAGAQWSDQNGNGFVCFAEDIDPMVADGCRIYWDAQTMYSGGRQIDIPAGEFRNLSGDRKYYLFFDEELGNAAVGEYGKVNYTTSWSFIIGHHKMYLGHITTPTDYSDGTSGGTSGGGGGTTVTAV